MATRILIVDDDPIILKLVQQTLTRAGFEIAAAHNGTEALKQAEAVRPELIVSDVMMPEMDGYTLCRRLRDNPATARLPILLLTAQDTLEEKVHGLEAGADDYMTKPFQPSELQARVKALLRRSAVPAPGQALEQQSKVVAVYSLRGGSGVSSLAANLAVGLAQLWEQPTVLVDLSLVSGHGALMLNLSARTTWGDLARIAAGELDSEIVNRVLQPHPTGAHVLAVPRRPEQSELLTGEKVTRVLQLLIQQYSYLVLDLPHDFQETTLAGLDAAHEILTVMTPDLASVTAMASALDVFASLNYSREKIRLVLNQTIERRGLAQKDIESVLKRPFDLVIPFAQEAIVHAINTGVPCVLGAASTPLGALLEDFAFRVSQEEQRKQRPETPSEAWQRVARRAQQRKK